MSGIEDIKHLEWSNEENTYIPEIEDGHLWAGWVDLDQRKTPSQGLTVTYLRQEQSGDSVIHVVDESLSKKYIIELEEGEPYGHKFVHAHLYAPEDQEPKQEAA
jgi:hypothetical protein